ncbi:MAG: FtsX-like permease family protein [Luteitalea sp.]|nr:FtsX-like permease family protein [Luteitalea sp.]
MLNRLKPRLRALFRRAKVEQELDEELSYHLEKDVQRHIAQGMSLEEARLAVRRGFGNVELFKEESRDARGTRLFDDFVQDVRYVIRTLRKSPGFTTAVVLTLALGIGMTTAIFTMIHGVLLRSLPFKEPDRLVLLYTVMEGEGEYERLLSPPNFMSLQAEPRRSFAEIAAVRHTSPTLVGVGEAQRLEGAGVSAGFFEALRVRPFLGRTFRPEESEPGEVRAVVLGHALWQQQFGGDRDIIGRAITLDRKPHTVVGVMPPRFDFPSECALWVPLEYGGEFSATTTAHRYLHSVVPVLARLRPGVSLEAARAELRLLGRRLEERFPETNRGTSFTTRPLHEEIVEDVRTPLLLLFGAVGLVLVIACANVASLLLARAAGRRDEIAVRAALGAQRGRIVRQLVTESLVLGLGGGLLGLGLAFWATDRLVTMWPEELPGLDAIRVDGTVLAFTFGIAIGASLLAGVVPAFRASAGGRSATLQSGGRSGLGSQRGQRTRSVLVVGQLALAVVLLVGAGLLLESFARLTTVDTGFRTERILSFQIGLPDTGYGSLGQVRAFYNQFLERVRQQPGVRSAATISRLPIEQGPDNSGFRAEGRTLRGVRGQRAPSPGEEQLFIDLRIVSPAFFETMGVPLLRGRGIREQDAAGSLPTVVINHAAAKRFFAGEDPLGRRLRDFWDDQIAEVADAFTIVGVVGDMRSRRLDRAPAPEVYFAHAQVPLSSMWVTVRAAGDPLTLTGPIRRELKALDPSLPVPEFRTFEQVIADSVSRPRFVATLVTLFSAVALTLAAVGIFGLLSFAVAQRTHEIGIRIALGASPRTLVETVVREALVLVVIGLALGIGGALALTRVLEAQLYGVSATDPVTFTIVALVLGGIALIASLIPAWRAATVDPLVALRAE